MFTVTYNIKGQPRIALFDNYDDAAIFALTLVGVLCDCDNDDNCQCPAYASDVKIS